MHTVKKILKFFFISIISLFVCMFSTICYSAWPLFEMPTSKPKAHREYVYSSDQNLSGYKDFIYDDRGNLITTVSYSGPGDDGVWFNKDDQGGNVYAEIVYDNSDRRFMLIYYDGPGPDGISLTDDDIIRDVEKVLYDSNGDIYRIIDYIAPGPDGIWLTSDDVVEDYKDIIYDYVNYSFWRTDYIEPGNDGIWFTADDQIEEYRKIYNHSNFRPYLSKEFIGSGEDGQWFTADDVKREQFDYFYDDSWNLTKSIETKTNGEIKETIYHYDGNNNCIRSIHKNNDGVSYYKDYAYDSQNRMIETHYYSNPGLDAIWFTSDDAWTSKRVYEFNTSLCSYTISPTNQNFNSSGGSITVNIDVNSLSCRWRASESLSWVTLSTNGGTGDGSVTVKIAPNSSKSSRSGTVNIAGEIFSVSQSETISEGVLINGGFETGDLFGWDKSLTEGISVVSNYNANSISVDPAEGNYFALFDMTIFNSSADAFIHQELYLNKGDLISGKAAFYNFENNDTEYAYIRIYDYNAAQYHEINWHGIIGQFPWTDWSWTAPSNGNYIIHFGVQSMSTNSVAMFDMNALNYYQDDDGDGVLNGLDKCPQTPIGSVVYDNGCVMIKGDINLDKKIDLDDSQLGLKVLTLQQNSADSSVDVDGDGKIGLKDTIYTIKKNQEKSRD